MSSRSAGIRVVVADDDPFTLSLVAGGLEGRGFEVYPASTVAEAWDEVAEHDPHVVVTDLDFGDGPSGVTLLARLHGECPWVGLVVLTAHRSPALAVEDPGGLPPGAVYVVKSALRHVDDLADAVNAAIAGGGQGAAVTEDADSILTLTAAQAEVLRMLAAGASTRALAEHRGTTVRAAETMLTRLFGALGLEVTERSNPRVEAVRLWQQGRVAVR